MQRQLIRSQPRSPNHPLQSRARRRHLSRNRSRRPSRRHQPSRKSRQSRLSHRLRPSHRTQPATSRRRCSSSNPASRVRSILIARAMAHPSFNRRTSTCWNPCSIIRSSTTGKVYSSRATQCGPATSSRDSRRPGRASRTMTARSPGPSICEHTQRRRCRLYVGACEIAKRRLAGHLVSRERFGHLRT